MGKNQIKIIKNGVEEIRLLSAEEMELIYLSTENEREEEDFLSSYKNQYRRVGFISI